MNSMRSEPKRYLITTADERTWKMDRPVLFLGDWCTLYSRKPLWGKLDWEMAPYHWKDRTKLRTDYVYLREAYERILSKLGPRLNRIHNIDASDRYWRILVGPWLCYFVQIAFDRWSSVQQAVKQFSVGGTTILTGNENEMVPNDMGHFYNLLPTEAWNHHLYAFMIRHYTDVPFIEADAIEVTSQSGPTQRRRYQQLKRLYKALASKGVRDRDALFVATYLTNTDLTKLYLRFRQIPQYLAPVEPEQTQLDWGQRDWVLDADPQNRFEDCLLKLVTKQIPRVFLEGYRALASQVARLSWPRRPQAMFTSNAMWFDTVTMAYVAQNTERKSPLLCGQHGGVYGIAEFSFAEEHEIAISDKFLTWGWRDSNEQKLVPVGMLKPIHRRRRPKPDGRLLLVGMSTFSRYSYILTSESSIDFADYMERCFKFADALPQAIRHQLLVRLTARDVGWSQGARWRERFPDVEVDLGKATMPELMKTARLIVCTYNSTNFLEAIASDTPTVLIGDFKESPLRESAVPFFSELAAVGIVHGSPESAALHIAGVWANVEAWWNEPRVRRALFRFQERFCENTLDVVRRLEDVIREEIAVSVR
jgi:putative transferase (TIGR04331 family)